MLDKFGPLSVATTSRKRPASISDQLSKTPNLPNQITTVGLIKTTTSLYPFVSDHLTHGLIFLCAESILRLSLPLLSICTYRETKFAFTIKPWVILSVLIIHLMANNDEINVHVS